MVSLFSSVCSVISADGSLRASCLRRKRNQQLTRRALLVALSCLQALMLFCIPGRAQQSLQVLRHHLRPAVTSGQAVMVEPLPSGQRMNFSIVLPLRNQDALTSLLGQIYDPSSPNSLESRGSPLPAP